MAAPNANTFQLTTPRRPGTNDFNGIAKEDDANEPPDPTTMPNAAEWNTIEYILLAATRVMPVAVLGVTGGTTPTLNAFPNARTDLTSSSFTVTRNGAGDVSITWPANTFPTPVAPPVPALNAGPGMIYATAISNGVRVYTHNSSGVATDLSFTVEIR